MDEDGSEGERGREDAPEPFVFERARDVLISKSDLHHTPYPHASSRNANG